MRILGDGVLLLPSYPERVYSNSVKMKYRQHSDFLYLTGFDEHESLAVIEKQNDKITFTLFVKPTDKSLERGSEIWEGRRSGTGGAIKDFGVDKAEPITELAEKLPLILKKHSSIFFDDTIDQDQTAIVINARDAARKYSDKVGVGPIAIISPTHEIHRLRAVKDEEEIMIIRKSADISAKAITAAMKQTKPNTTEYEIEAFIEFIFRTQGARGPAYQSIVASGLNTNILHYVKNECTLKDTQLLLVDAGCEYQNYAADITRTWPINGKFTEPQKRIYTLVLNVQKVCIVQVKPGTKHQDLLDLAVRLISKGLLELGLLDGDLEKIISEKSYRRFYMHGLSHHVGLDTHDVPSITKKIELQAGHYITIEPGIYVPNDDDIPPEYRGIGVRIEDDILVTEKGNEILTINVPKEIEQIEEIVGSGVLV